MNDKHVRAMDPVIAGMAVKAEPSMTSAVIHLRVKLPAFLTNRDFVNVASFYILKDGSMILASTKCDDGETMAKPTSAYVRGAVTLSVYHIRPDYDGNVQHTR